MDTNIVDQYGDNNLDNVINLDCNQAIFMDGQYYIPTNTKAILIPESDDQFVISNTGNIHFNVSNAEIELGDNQIIHYIGEDQLIDNEEGSQIVYYTDDLEAPITMSQDAGFAFIDNIEPSLKKVKLEGDSDSIDSFLANIVNLNEQSNISELKNFQYVIQVGNSDPLADITENIATPCNVRNDNDTIPIDISKITGKNLLTGQKVTLDSYLEKVRNSNQEMTLKKAEEISQNIRNRSQHTPLSNLLNKKLTIGKTSTGQKLIGKVIRVGKKTIDEPSENTFHKNEQNEFQVEVPEGVLGVLAAGSYESVINPVVVEDAPTNHYSVPLDTLQNQHGALEFTDNHCESVKIEANESEESNSNSMSEQIVDYVSKTLTNIMNLESVAKKLKRKNLSIKINQKIVENEIVNINIYQMKGHLEMLGSWEEEGYQERWLFKVDPAEIKNENQEADTIQSSRKFPETMRITISVVEADGVIQSTKVNLHHCQEKCSVCSKEFRSLNKMKSHMKQAHKIFERQFYCQLCDESLEDKDVFEEHRQYHVDRNELFACTSCDKYFLSEHKMANHMFTHNPESWSLTCYVCSANFNKISSWKKHILSHPGLKQYSCDQCHKQFFTIRDLDSHLRVHDQKKNCYVCKVCNRTFSRYSNLQRHAEIHGKKNSASVFSCSICGCTYNYISSLTRHVVQNHISAT